MNQEWENPFSIGTNENNETVTIGAVQYKVWSISNRAPAWITKPTSTFRKKKTS